ncbi:uncharacterized protein BX663DRAFT_533712 [Cokeromyces recurvatus]|uniref:uncharacterized protein n=1 Tax=Cokeromyces recurvatus TaxID=90255 RepID=UPI0022212AD7|nr:uncharacterized protein BX663DRAFT_533712 [Cokeromyces recurvatus]KAI7897657.1 hypothetical protein BX663DRAFT_533712 [Cokeromyces recurvatus]
MEKYLNQNHISIHNSQDAIKGRYIKANAFLPRGTVIITSQPLGTVAIPQMMNEYCNYCFRKQTSPPLQRCSQCKKAYFCDMACFKNAWLSYHQFVCTAQSNHQCAEDELDLEMLERVALNVARYRQRNKMNKESVEDGETVEVTMEAFFSLMGHDTLQPRHITERNTALARKTLERKIFQGISQEELVHYLNVFRSNNFSITDVELFAIGEGTYPIASLFNHSCHPNAVVMFEGALACIRAIEDIQPGTEITIPYIDPAHSRKYRQTLLHQKYFFDCQCERCLENANRPYLSKIDTLLGEEESDWDRAEQLLLEYNHKHIDKRAQILKEIEIWNLLDMCQKYDRRHDGFPDHALTIASYSHYFVQFFSPYLLTCNQPELHLLGPSSSKTSCSLTDFDDPLPSQARPKVPSTCDDIMATSIDKMLSYDSTADSLLIIPYRLSTLSICTRLFYDLISEGKWQNAVKVGLYILVQYCVIYPPYHPMLAQHFLIMAKAGWNSIVQSELLVVGDKGLEKVYERGVRRWIVSAKETIAVAFGKQSKLWKEILELEWIFLREQKLK